MAIVAVEMMGHSPRVQSQFKKKIIILEFSMEVRRKKAR
jgi:hypothetical protein